MGSELLEVINCEGKLAAARRIGLDDATLLNLYETMVQVRLFEERCMILQRQGRLGFYIGCLGQEAVHIGSAAALRQSDWVFPQYREPGVPLLRGVPMRALLDQCYGNAADPTGGAQMPCHYSFGQVNYGSVSSPIGTQIIHAAGAAHAAKIRGDDTVVITYFGDGATSSNDFHTGMNFAGVFGSPCIFMAQNNGWAISVPLSRQTASENLAVKAVAYGFEGIRVDGNDVLAVYQVTRQAAEKARAGGGPTLIEAVTYRMGSHSSSDDASRYRDPRELEAWKAKDPIKRCREFLESNGLWNRAREEEFAEKTKTRIAEAVSEAEAVPAPPPERLFTGVYAQIPWHLAEQREALLAEKRLQLGESEAFPL